MKRDTVKVPPEMQEAFEKAGEYVDRYFADLAMDPTRGTVTIGGERYVIVRASAWTVDFIEFIKNMYPALSESEAIDAGSRVVYDHARSVGISDARHFHGVTRVTDPIERLSTGPLHFSYTGWAKVEILPESRPRPDESYFLVYDHVNTFESDAWIKARERVDFCTCYQSAGYSAGWCTESFGVPLDAREITCRARGDACCRFVMAHRDRIDEMVEAWLEKRSGRP